MADKDLRIKITTVADTSGADAATASLRKVGDQSDEAADKSSRLKEVGMAAGAIGASAKVAASAIREVIDEINNVDVDRLNNLDPDMAEEFKNIAFWAQAAQDPIAALIDQTNRWLSGETVSEAFAAMEDGLKRLEDQNDAHIDRMIAMGIRKTDELKRVADAIAAGNRVIDARDSADTAARDRADKNALRGGADPDQVAKSRAEFDASQEIAKIERDLKAKASAAAGLNENADRAAINAMRIAEDRTATPEDQQKAGIEAGKAREEAKAANRAVADAEDVARENIRAIRERQMARQEEAEYQRQQREAEIQRKHAADNDRLEREQQAEAKRAALEAAAGGARAGLDADADTAAGKFNIAAGRAPNKNTRDALRRISDSLDDGTDAREIAALQQKFEAVTRGMGGATVRALQKMLTQMETQAAAIEKLEAQMKNSRRAGQ